MKIGVISDTHIPDRTEDIPAEILEAFKGVDMVIHAGDLVEYGVIDKLKSVCKDVRAVWGNMDPYDVRKRLPDKEIIKIGKYRVGVTHGYGHPSKLVDMMEDIFRNDGVDLVIFGHSHSAISEKRGNTIYFNPGSATDKVYAKYNSYGIIEINDKIDTKIVRI
ncbi:MAG: metallophosphoesterase [Candidatus Omnitrophota bacterium]|jgi:hypothetical protein